MADCPHPAIAYSTLSSHSCPLPGPAGLPLCSDVSSSSAAGHARAVGRAAALGAGAAAVAPCSSPAAQRAAACPGRLLQVLRAAPRAQGKWAMGVAQQDTASFGGEAEFLSLISALPLT